MKKHLLPLGLSAALIVIMSGCVQSTALNLGVNMKTGVVTLKNPKDTIIKNYKTTVSKDGSVSIAFDSLYTLNNPAVVEANGDSQAKNTDAIFNGAERMLNAGAGIAAKVVKP